MEAAIDEGSIKTRRAREPVSELELELKDGAIGAMYQLAAELQAQAHLSVLPESKAARGWFLRTAQTEGGQAAAIPRLARSMRAAAAFHEILTGTLGHLTANVGSELRGDPEA